jgi:pimeloyl-ACP methyl ester carboxylesterase
MIQRDVSNGDVRLAVYESGNPRANAVLFIHGWSQGALSWSPQLDDPALGERFRLVALDLRGHGSSDKPAEGYDDSERWAADIRAVIDALSLKNVSLVGWSYGGYVICDYLRVHGERDIAKLVFAGASTDLGVPTPYRARASAWDGLLPVEGSSAPSVFSLDAESAAIAMESFTRRVFHGGVKQAKFLEMLGLALQTPPRVRSALFRRKLRNDEVLARTASSALVAYGAHDTLVDPKTSLHIAEKLPNATLSRYDESGHAPFLEEPERFNRELSGFLSG